MKKQFFIQVEPASETRFLCNDDELCAALATMARAVMDVWTDGPRPAVQVTVPTMATVRAGEPTTVTVVLKG